MCHIILSNLGLYFFLWWLWDFVYRRFFFILGPDLRLRGVVCFLLSFCEGEGMGVAERRREYANHGPLARYIRLRVAHAPGMPGTFSQPSRFSDPDMHHGTCVTHVPWCISGSLISGLPWSRWQEKRSRHSLRMHNPQFYVSGKRPIGVTSHGRLVSFYRVFDCLWKRTYLD